MEPTHRAQTLAALLLWLPGCAAPLPHLPSVLNTRRSVLLELAARML